MEKFEEILKDVYQYAGNPEVYQVMGVLPDFAPVLEAMKQAYNLGVQDAAENARLETACKDHTCTGCSGGCCMPVTRLHKQSILNLKIQ